MSQHVFETMYKGKPAEVFIGWDRPMGQFFMVVENIDIDEDVEEDEYIYSNLNDPNISKTSVKESPNYFKDILSVYEIQLPPQIWAELENDKQNNTSDSKTIWNTDGSKSFE